IKISIVQWLAEMVPDQRKLDNLYMDLNLKTQRGLHNDVTAMLLGNVRWDWTDMNVRNMVLSGTLPYHITCDNWPKFVYSLKDYDPDDLEKGLFRGILLVKAFKSIFTSPSSADDVAISDDESRVTDDQPMWKRRKMLRKQGPKQGSVAQILGMCYVHHIRFLFIFTLCTLMIPPGAYPLVTLPYPWLNPRCFFSHSTLTMCSYLS
ncbi:hypothetical protein DAEQUDRAFT_679630, partial [Daedalea quercina L-15889]